VQVDVGIEREIFIENRVRYGANAAAKRAPTLSEYCCTRSYRLPDPSVVWERPNVKCPVSPAIRVTLP